MSTPGLIPQNPKTNIDIALPSQSVKSLLNRIWILNSYKHIGDFTKYFITFANCTCSSIFLFRVLCWFPLPVSKNINFNEKAKILLNQSGSKGVFWYDKLLWWFIQGPVYKWTEHSLFLYFGNYKVGGAPITPCCWIGVDGMNLDHNITQKIHIKIFLMRVQKKFEFRRTWL